ncbi:alkaline phosphatase PhoX [Nocardia sp. XZ_19_369]|uniref:alkaline phosphatase PhoX n=1 Tax=Nocardia sp. XZ_19_369 TaxID=2769487 RepID=UPI00188F0D3E|nr:alkaline phosphatase PhoX [Nocardia sp. XZ_19_369]
MDRRNFLRVSVIGGGGVALGGAAWLEAFSAGAVSGESPYGPLSKTPDANGVFLPSGFTSRIVARSGQRVAGSNYTWHPAPDGGACFADGTGWIYVSNSEVDRTGGVGAIVFGADGTIVGAHRTLSGTSRNCAGGATPWNTWLSCEEVDKGAVFETDPWGRNTGTRRPAMGLFTHEACAADPDRKVIYLTEDRRDGCFYRFVPTSWSDLSSGKLEVLVESSGNLSWKQVPDPSARSRPTRQQVRGAKVFNGGEGCYYAGGTCWFTTKGDNKVWAYNAAGNQLSITYEPGNGAPLSGVDNVTGASNNDLFIAEDGGDMQICLIAADVVAPFLQIANSSGSEIAGPAFNPAGDRLYFSSQRGTTGSSSGGITYEVTGPFRR